MTGKLPERYFQELEQIQANISEQQIELAIPRALNLYEEYPTFDANKLLVHALLLSDEDDLALSYLTDFDQQYRNKIELIDDVLNTLLTHHAFVLAWQLNHRLNLEKNNFIESAEQNYQLNNAKKIAELTRQVSSVGTLALEEQSVILKQAKYLPLSSYRIAVQLVLQDPDVWQPVKSDILQTLKLAGVTDKIVVTGTFQAKLPVNLATIDNEIQGSKFQQIKEIVWKQIGAIDPVQWQIAEKELFLQSAYLYPNADQIIQNPDIWADLLIQKLKGESPIVNDEVAQQLLEIQRQLDQKIHEDLGF
ncbi:hypothetical protein OXT66_08160 [Lentilactobacillus senioris]|uniref:hypothetical protein n=1 Tax=Lentilactobacillus senioris TaxID=931534 RepID=UPI0022812DF8|nr:hypothetical protein [Lentilactobacillus senioris]MCY9807506.1 hypothetical protein [Lentilactobacillus senioris]